MGVCDRMASFRAAEGTAVAIFFAMAVVCSLFSYHNELTAATREIVAEGSEPKWLYVLRDTPDKNGAQWLKKANYDIHHKHHDVLEVVAERRDRSRILGMGMDLLEEMQDGGFGAEDKSKGYHNLSQLHAAFKKLAQKHRSRAHYFSLTKRYKMPKTVEGREIYAMKISDNVENDADKPNVLFVSNHHARELIVPELALHTATQLLESKDPAVKHHIANNQIYIIYTMNPDGLNAVWTKNKWQRKNARGVDLNRNYPVGFATRCGGDAEHSSECYRGNKPFSEIETQTMRAFQKDRNFAKLIDFHSYSREVRVNYGPCAPLPKKMHQLFVRHAKKVARSMRYEQSQSCCMGGDIHFAYNHHGTLSYLVETGEAFQPPAQLMRKELTRVYPGILRMLEVPISLSGHVRDKKTKRPVAAVLTVPGLKFGLNEQSTAGANGRYHLWLPHGKWKVVVTAKGYPRQSFHVKAANKGAVHELELSRK